MPDVLQQKQSGKLRFDDSDYVSSTSFSLASSVGSEASDSSNRIDDSVLASKQKFWPYKIGSFDSFAYLNFNGLTKNGGIPLKESKDYKTDARWIIVICFAVFIIAYKMVIVAVPYANKDSFFEVTSYAQDKYQDLLNWANENEMVRERLTRLLLPQLCGLFVSIFSVMMVYFDSNIPGIDPPSPFSINSKQRYQQKKRSSIRLAYMTAIFSGVVVSGLMYLSMYQS